MSAKFCLAIFITPAECGSIFDAPYISLSSASFVLNEWLGFSDFCVEYIFILLVSDNIGSYNFIKNEIRVVIL